MIKTLFAIFTAAIFAAQVLAQEAPRVGSIKAAKPISDKTIELRINKILNASEKFDALNVEVEEGIARLRGQAKNEEDKQLAQRVAEKVEGVIFTYNEIEVTAPERFFDWDLLRQEMKILKENFWSIFPRFIFALMIILLGYFAAKGAARLLRPFYHKKYPNPFMANLATKVALSPLIVVVIYLSLQITGLTRLAVTVLTGTGLVGLALGIAFRNIAENFFASILLSIQRPYEIGDLVEIGGQFGYVRQLTSRGTTLMTLDGNHVQIPNSKAYSEILMNFSANKNMRLFFTVGIGYEDKIAKAQEVALEVLKSHPSLLKKPEPLVLVEALGASTVSLGIYFWLDTSRYSQFKTKSSVIRLVKNAFEREGISMPDEAREIIFPKGVPIVPAEGQLAENKFGQKSETTRPDDDVASESEGDLNTEFSDIEDQSMRSRQLEGGENLLTSQGVHGLKKP